MIKPLPLDSWGSYAHKGCQFLTILVMDENRNTCFVLKNPVIKFSRGDDECFSAEAVTRKDGLYYELNEGDGDSKEDFTVFVGL